MIIHDALLQVEVFVPCDLSRPNPWLSKVSAEQMTYSNNEPAAADAIRNTLIDQICRDLDHVTSNAMPKWTLITFQLGAQSPMEPPLHVSQVYDGVLNTLVLEKLPVRRLQIGKK